MSDCKSAQGRRTSTLTSSPPPPSPPPLLPSWSTRAILSTHPRKPEETRARSGSRGAQQGRAEQKPFRPTSAKKLQQVWRRREVSTMALPRAHPPADTGGPLAQLTAAERGGRVPRTYWNQPPADGSLLSFVRRHRCTHDKSSRPGPAHQTRRGAGRE